MSNFQILKPHKGKEFIRVNEPFLGALVEEPVRENKRGRRRIAERWVIVVLAIIARLEGITWRKLGKERNWLCVIF